MAWFWRKRRRAATAAVPAPTEPMVNRKLELELLRDHMETVGGGRGHAVLLLGDSGVGKSRLVAELVRESEQLQMVAILSRGLGRGAEPLLPVKDALREYLGTTPDKVRRTLLSAAPRLLDSIPFIGAFLGKIGETLVDSRSLYGASLDGIYEELSRVLLGVSERHGLCFVVEDLHDADQDTLYFVNYLLGKIRGRRVLVLMTAQSEQLREAPNLQLLTARWSAEGLAALTVTPLERAHVGEYVRSVLALGGEPDEGLIDQVFRLTGGNPFYLKETLHILSDTGGDGAIADDAVLKLPPGLDAVVRQRLARADADVRELLDAAAVVADGSQDIEAVLHVMEAPMGKAVRILRRACELGILQEGPAGEISFVHGIMRNAVYGELGAAARKYLHSRAAEWFDERAQPASAAGHFERAGRTADMVRTALQAAAHAEQQGLYHSALFYYQKARPHMAIEEIGPRLGRALITLGDWAGADEVIQLLPADDSGTCLLRSQLCFVRGDFEGSLAAARTALADPDVDRVAVLHRIGDIELYLGNFDDARQYAEQAQAAADGAPIPSALLCALLGAISYFRDELDAAETYYRRGLDLIAALPEQQQDALIETMLRGNLANVALTRGDLVTATEIHAAALKKRREVADVRGALHSMHALGMCHLRAGDTAAAVELFEQTEQLAASLGETLERAKVAQTRGLLALEQGEVEQAYDLIRGALDSFGQSQCRYDITHARVALSMAAAAAGREREAAELGALARADVAAHGYGLLRRMYPETVFSLAERIGGSLTAYACGDALGLPYETYPPEGPSGASTEEIETVHAREGWEIGSTSDDTALTLLVGEYLLNTSGDGGAEGFLALLGERAGEIKGLGPSTTKAVEHFAETGQIAQDQAGNTNGAAMRALPVGWTVGIGDRARLQERVAELSRPTHRSPDALVAACVIAECGAWAAEGASRSLLMEIATEAAAQATQAYEATTSVSDALARVADGTWTVPDHGPSMDPAETVSAVLYCVHTGQPLREAIVTAIGLGGDADTVAAMTGGLLGAAYSREQVMAQLPYASELKIPDGDRTAALAEGLVALRRAGR
ncbi:ADP-ribosylglycohydrolase family protein [Catellatospora citrea]|uniref:ATP-binding protein n=1 Tax=Catellatospora citrea TaxID=53366 RepID=UPI0033FC2CAB